MTKLYLTKPIKVALGETADQTKARLAKLLGVVPVGVRLHKQSIDARDKGDVHFVCSYIVECNRPKHNAQPFEPLPDLFATPLPKASGSCIVVGAGPCGLFLARYLCGCGVKVTVVERGSDVDKRSQKVKAFFDGGDLDENCNVQFGLGGAGTFSDGKLTTGSSSPLVNTVFQELVRCGAPQEILTSAMPHIGTDNLVKVVGELKNKIQQQSGTFLFDTTVTDLIVENGKAVGVEISHNGKSQKLFAQSVALCCGHSAKNMFHALVKHGVQLQFKPFAVGLRIEHPQQFINLAQYGKLFATHKDLGAATYKLVHNMQSRSCYSFCMCPGGVVVAAVSEQNTVVVNGMSNFDRSAPNANSALVVSVNQTDVENWGYGKDALSGLRFVEDLEKVAYNMGGGSYVAPCQNVVDFLANRPSVKLDLVPTYPRGTKPTNLRELLPNEISQALAESIAVFDTKIQGFGKCGVLTGVETRTSSPVKILRDQTCQTNLQALFPAGEGGGHAGGIVTSAVDGLKVAKAIVEYLNK